MLVNYYFIFFIYLILCFNTLEMVPSTLDIVPSNLDPRQKPRLCSVGWVGWLKIPQVLIAFDSVILSNGIPKKLLLIKGTTTCNIFTVCTVRSFRINLPKFTSYMESSWVVKMAAFGSVYVSLCSRLRTLFSLENLRIYSQSTTKSIVTTQGMQIPFVYHYVEQISDNSPYSFKVLNFGLFIAGIF